MTANPLVLVHGFMGGGDQWALQRDALGRSRELIAVDLPGFGGANTKKAPSSIAGFARHVLDHLTSLEIATFDLMGHSMGGMIVQEMVAADPQRVSRLCLYGTAAVGNLPNRFESFAATRDRISKEGVETTANRISATWFLHGEEAPQFEACAAIARRASPQALQSGLTAMETWSGTDNLEAIACPTLIVWGEFDRSYGWGQIEQLWRGIPNAHLSVIPGCAHAAHMEKPQIFNPVVADFFGV